MATMTTITRITSQTIPGAPTIRAFNRAEDFITENEVSFKILIMMMVIINHYDDNYDNFYDTEYDNGYDYDDKYQLQK